MEPSQNFLFMSSKVINQSNKGKRNPFGSPISMAPVKDLGKLWPGRARPPVRSFLMRLEGINERRAILITYL
jgi:hypothetical protein